MKRFILVVLAIVLGAIAMQGQTTTQSKKQSDWKEVQKVEIPTDIEIHEGLTKNGNPKFWIIVADTNVTVSSGNAAKFKAGEVKLELVKWQNSKTGAYKYSTRQVKGSHKSESKNIDLSKLF